MAVAPHLAVGPHAIILACRPDQAVRSDEAPSASLAFPGATTSLIRAGNSNIVVRAMVSGNLTVWRIVGKIFFCGAVWPAPAPTIRHRRVRASARPANGARRYGRFATSGGASWRLPTLSRRRPGAALGAKNGHFVRAQQAISLQIQQYLSKKFTESPHALARPARQ